MVDEHRESSHRHDEELHSKRVVVVVVRRPELGIHQIYRGVRRHDEEHLHHGVVDGHERCEQVQIACGEDHCKHDL